MIPQIRPSQLSEWLQSQPADARPVVLDVREDWELEAASIAADPAYDVVAIPMGDVPARIAEIDPTRPVACLCHHGARSQRVAAFLAGHGFENVANIAGGIEAWSGERDPGVPRY
ncbi:MAG: rhodanese-like domain-containing protein [Pseudomonadota bacterium]